MSRRGAYRRSNGAKVDAYAEAESRFKQNITAIRGEEGVGFNAEPYVRTGKFVKILGF